MAKKEIKFLNDGKL